jgi:hypothetical protein
MRSLFKLSLAALIALAFAGTAMAVDVKFSGNIGTAFGLANLGETGPADNQAAISAYATSYEANVRTTIGGGPLTQVVRFRPRGSNINGATGDWNVADVYAETNWRPIDNLLIQMGRMQGGAWSNPLAGAYLIHNAIGVTHQEYWLNWTGADGLDIEFNLGAMQIGVALASECRPFCGSTTSGAKRHPFARLRACTPISTASSATLQCAPNCPQPVARTVLMKPGVAQAFKLAWPGAVVAA